jgi:glycosyltransferase involved in cell wall biosynthesis
MSSIDVVIPCYRYAHFLSECVASVLSSSGTSARVLIIDDASPDDTAEVGAKLAQSDARVTFIRNQKNLGHIATYNKGIEWASADYFLLLSADDYLLPDALGRATAFMDARPHVGFSFGKVILSDKSGISLPELPKRAERDPKELKGYEFISLIARSRATNIVPTPTAIVRTELQKRVGGYSPDLPHTGDLEMWLRLAAHAPVARFQTFQAVYRQHGNNMQRSYYDIGWQLPDLKQRKAAFDQFIVKCGNLLPKPREIHSRLLRSLACDALRVAGGAFNAEDAVAVRQLYDFALELSPQAARSIPGLKLAAKKKLGLSFWRKLGIAMPKKSAT